MDGIFRDVHLNILKQAVDEAKKRQFPIKVFQLDCSLQILLERDKKRVEETNGIRKPLGDVNITHIYENLKNNPVPNAEIIDTQRRSLEECIAIIKKLIPED